MERGNVCILVVDDNDMNCDSTKDNINNMSIINVGFSASILDRYQFVIYKGIKGSKVLKSTYGVPTGIIVENV